MRTGIVRIAAFSLLLAAACAREPVASTPVDAGAGIDSLNARVERAYRDGDAAAYAALYTDSAVFEWPAVTTVRGRAGLEAMARSGWTALPDMKLKLIVASRRFAPDHATELGAFEQSWRDSTGGRSTEFGRYVTVLERQADGRWLMDRFFGFSDSTRSVPAAR